MLNQITIHPDAPESLREAIINYNEVADAFNECSTNSHICAREVIDFGEDIDPDEIISLMTELKVLGVRLDAARDCVEEEVGKLDLN